MMEGPGPSVTALTQGDLDRRRLHEVDALLAQAFPEPEGGYVHPQEPAFLVLAERDGALVGHLAAYLRRAMLGPAQIDLGMIGAVAVASAHRGHGIAKRMLGRAHERLRETGVVHSVLFAYEPRHYLSSGYCPMRNETRFVENDEVRQFVYRGGMVADLSDRPWTHDLLLDLRGPTV